MTKRLSGKVIVISSPSRVPAANGTSNTSMAAEATAMDPAAAECRERERPS
jgi:hypothetical protein